jgi:hypothetical protein
LLRKILLLVDAGSIVTCVLGDYKGGWSSCRQNLVEVGREEKEVTGDYEMPALLKVDFLVLGRRGNVLGMSASATVTSLWRDELNLQVQRIIGLWRRRSYADE